MIEFIKKIDLTLKENKQKNFYHYRRWLWIMFPWCCMHAQYANFSSLIDHCFRDSTQYMSVEEEHFLHLATLNIVYGFKSKAKNLLKNKLDDPTFQLGKSTNYQNFRSRVKGHVEKEGSST